MTPEQQFNNMVIGIIQTSLYAPQVDMSSQQFPRSGGAPPTNLGPAPPPIPTSGSTGLINPASTGKAVVVVLIVSSSSIPSCNSKHGLELLIGERQCKIRKINM